MIEQGLVMFIQSGLSAGSPPFSGVPGGFGDMITPKDLISAAIPQAWVYKTVSAIPDYTLEGRTGWTEWNVQIDCHGFTKKDAIVLRKAIWETLRNGFQGNFSDPDETYVFGIFERERPPSMFNDANRTFVDALEYQVIYQQE